MVRIDQLAYRLVLTGGVLASSLLAEPAAADQTQTPPGGSPSPAVAPAAGTAQPPAVPQNSAIGVPPMGTSYGTQGLMNWAGSGAPLGDAWWDTYGRGR
jgi:hypothetical protein